MSWNAAFAGSFDDDGDTSAVDHSDDEEMERNGRKLKRIDSSKKPAHSSFDNDRDMATAGHQFMIARHEGALYVYDSEMTTTGKHLASVGKKDVSALADYLHDTPEIEHYRYVMVEGLLRPTKDRSRR